MQAGAAVSAGPFDANSTSTSLLNQLQAHRQSYRSTSLSSGSAATIKRPGSLSRVRSQSPDDSEAAHIPLRLGRDPMSSQSPDHKRRKSVAIDPSEHPSSAHESIGAGLGSVNRWSHSTSSSLGSLANANSRRNRSSSGAVLTSLTGQQYGSPRQKPLTALDASPRSSPRRHHVNSYSPISSPERSRRQSRAENLSTSLTALPPLHTTPALTDPNDTESPSTVQTLPTPQGLNYVHDDYFDDGYGMAKTKRVVMVRNPSAPVTVSQSSRAAQSEQLETSSSTSRIDREQRQRTTAPDGTGSSSRKPRNREKMEKDKKTMLSKALQKANTAVLLDNAQNYEGALEAYGDACDLLTQVMDRTSGDDDKRKLDAIRVTYSNRMEELQLLLQEGPPTSHEKHLPARPMSDDSLSLRTGPISPMNAVSQEQEGACIATPRGNGNAPRLSYSHNDRDSFFSRTMAAVENSASFTSETGNFSEEPLPVQARGESDAPEQLQRMTIPPPEHAQYVPRPLSPRRPIAQSPQSPQSPKLQPQAEQAWQLSPEPTQERQISAPRDGADTQESTSWLDPIDESGSSCSDSLHSRSSRQGTRRKHLRELSGETDPDFDAAFDAAVEAAYDEGFEPDLEARRKRETAHRMRTQKESIQVPASEIEEIMPGIYQSKTAINDEDEEEERILDDLASNYGNAFNFDLKTTKSAIPRASDSSGYSRSTWQSSQMSDRATAATSLSTVAEDGLTSRMSKAPLRESTALPTSSAPPRSSLPRPPSVGNNRASNVRSRRLSGMNAKQLKIETAAQNEVRKRASTFHHASSPFMEDDEQTGSESDNKIGEPLEHTISEVQHEHILQSPPSLELHAALDEIPQSFDASTTMDHRPSYEEAPGDLPAGTRPTLFRKNKSSVSLRDHAEHQVLLASPDLDSSGMSNAMTPMSSTFMSFAAAKRNQNPLASQRAQLPSFGHASVDSQQLGGGIHLFDTSLSATQAPLSPRSPSSPLPASLEPCPEPSLLRPFWFMRALSSTIVHPRGGFLTSKLFIPRQVWETKGVKLKFVEDKIANCDLLTAALGRLAGVDTYDADAVAEELQSFEEVMDRVQGALAKKLGSDVGVHGATGMFKDATSATLASGTGSASDTTAGAEKATKSNSGKSYLTSWRKLRNKSSGTPLSAGLQPANAKSQGEKESHTMQSVPMTTFVPVERRGNKKEARNLVFEGVNREYMGSLARLFDGVQILDQIARQVEDPGLKHSSPTHIGLELSIRHAAEFFGFYLCRFVLADLGLLMDKFLKRGTEWVLA